MSNRSAVNRSLIRDYLFSEDELLLFGGQDRAEKRYLSASAYRKLRCYLEEGVWLPVVHNKLLSSNYYRGLGIRTPRMFGFLHASRGFLEDGRPLKCGKALLDWARKRASHPFVLKHIGSGLGSYVFIVQGVVKHNGQDALLTISNRAMTAADIDIILNVKEGSLEGFIVEEKLELHEDIARLCGGGLASVRLNTLARKNMPPKVQLAYVRLGLPGKATDHSGNGGLMVPLDLGDGRLSRGLDTINNEWVDRHPATSAVIPGKTVPDWNAVKELATNMAALTPGLHWVGWDIVPTSSGPVFLEGNVGQPLTMYQRLFGGFLENKIFEEWHEELGCPFPDGTRKWHKKVLEKKMEAAQGPPNHKKSFMSRVASYTRRKFTQ